MLPKRWLSRSPRPRYRISANPPAAIKQNPVPEVNACWKSWAFLPKYLTAIHWKLASCHIGRFFSSLPDQMGKLAWREASQLVSLQLGVWPWTPASKWAVLRHPSSAYLILSGQGANLQDPEDEVLDGILKAPESSWIPLLKREADAGRIRQNSFQSAVRKRMETIVLALPSGSNAQRIQVS